MATACITQVTFGFEPQGRPIVAAFDMPDSSSDGGALLLKGVDTQLSLTRRLAACLDDPRQPAKIQHQGLELLRQRVFGLACGYADCNDAARLADDVIHKLLVDRDPIAGPALASQPTLSRFEALARGGSMATACIPQVTFGFEPQGRPIVAAFDMPDSSSDGGALLLKGVDTQIGRASCRERV